MITEVDEQSYIYTWLFGYSKALCKVGAVRAHNWPIHRDTNQWKREQYYKNWNHIFPSWIPAMLSCSQTSLAGKNFSANEGVIAISKRKTNPTIKILSINLKIAIIDLLPLKGTIMNKKNLDLATKKCV